MKKIISILFGLLGMTGNIFSEKTVESYSSGRDKIQHIIVNEFNNQKNLHYALVQNIEKDLYIEEVAKHFSCNTDMGNAFMAEVLKRPLSKQEKNKLLLQRKNNIKILIENPELKEKIDNLLLRAKNIESGVIKLMSQEFKFQTCPEFKKWQKLKDDKSKMADVLEAIFFNSARRFCLFAGSIYVIASEVANMIKSSAEAYYCFNKLGFDNTFFELSIITLGHGVYAGYCAYATHKDYAFALQKRKVIHALSELVAVSQEINTLSQKYSINLQFNLDKIDDNLADIINQLAKSKYKNKDSWILVASLVHVFLYKIYKYEEYLAPIFMSVAEVDAYNAIATKMIEFKDTRNKYCFANFIEEVNPTIKACNFWNVLVKNAIPNNIDESKSIILTGPNAGGKTTFIRALLLNFILAQSFSIAAAETFDFTMFDIIHSYLNISDDILNGYSLFAAEIKRAKDILYTTKSLKEGETFFFALDELFTGTVAEDGATCAYEFIKRLSEAQNVRFIYATHFEKLKELGASSQSCINYKVDAPVKDDTGMFVYPYTISLGASNDRIALDIARKAGLFD